MTAQPPIVVSMGDPAGVGPEIILKAWQRLRHHPMVFAAIGDFDLFSRTASTLGLPGPIPIDSPALASAHFADCLPVLGTEAALCEPVIPGQANPAHAAATKSAIEAGVRYCLDGEASALVTAPIAKSVMYAAGFSFPGHTEFLAGLTAQAPLEGPRGPAMMLTGGGLRVVLVTIHEPLQRAISLISEARIQHIARLTHHALKQDYGIARPRLALAGLNPHAGEGGSLGDEEIRILNPAAEQLRAEGIEISDARPPDTLFHEEARKTYDAVVCMYHDQGLIPVKTLDFHGGVNVTLGLPIIRTSPDHGTAFDIAGTGEARADSLLAAIREAKAIASHRR
ncbi:4-hydroxythreonine-4-phosphate dehydrogenase PdxA [Maricaulis parjimensis]|uniref:4-hydroxythreonine-4-phosphate dehydrogenase PdxA n=1 Tax=Maricaulis parjimensis TaxID=144023 RepID=UPI00193A1A78|nr:4-hydroxythreonine-4-phosphate dehydrogenase PdxA [Maricaulis parjimensis]